MKKSLLLMVITALLLISFAGCSQKAEKTDNGDIIVDYKGKLVIYADENTRDYSYQFYVTGCGKWEEDEYLYSPKKGDYYLGYGCKNVYGTAGSDDADAIFTIDSITVNGISLPDSDEWSVYNNEQKGMGNRGAAEGGHLTWTQEDFDKAGITGDIKTLTFHAKFANDEKVFFDNTVVVNVK